MSRIATKTFVATVFVAIAAAGLLALSKGEDSSARPQIVKLERVVIVGKRTPEAAEGTQLAQRIERLPRVVIEGRRMSGETRLAAAKPPCAAESVC